MFFDTKERGDNLLGYDQIYFELLGLRGALQ